MYELKLYQNGSVRNENEKYHQYQVENDFKIVSKKVINVKVNILGANYF